ncbi:MAG: hypothetical protein R3F23_00605 [Verrucomicrobiia bacterium]
MNLFPDLKKGFQTILADSQWLPKILFGGFLLINPFLIILLLWMVSPGEKSILLKPLFYGTLAFNVLTFWFPLGFTYEVLRRARTGSAPQLPDWNMSVLPRYVKEGAVKLILAITTLLLPVGVWMGICYFLFIQILGLPPALLSMFYPPAMLFVIPFCGVACCRWLDGDSVINCALNYPKNLKVFCSRKKEFLLASFFLTGLNTVLCSFIITIPFAAVFGLCLVDTWFGPIYADAVREQTNEPTQ